MTELSVENTKAYYYLIIFGVISQVNHVFEHWSAGRRSFSRYDHYISLELLRMKHSRKGFSHAIHDTEKETFVFGMFYGSVIHNHRHVSVHQPASKLKSRFDLRNLNRSCLGE